MKQFKDYAQGQMQLLPPSLEELVPEGHLSRVINTFIDNLDTEALYQAFPGGGAPPYHPIMMLKVLIYSYCTKTFSSREIERNLKQDIVHMWLSGMQRPDHNTVNRFRSYYLSNVLDEVFFQVVWMLHEKGYMKLKDLFVDGTKQEAEAGRYTHVWRKNVERYKQNAKEKIKLLLEEIETLNESEDQLYGDNPLSELTIAKEFTSDEVKQAAQSANSALNKKGNKRAVKKKINELEKAAEKLNNYETQEKILGDRNSYSKTDNDATFMRMKDDRLRPGYTPIISTNNQYIVNVTVSQNAADNVGFKEHVEKLLSWSDGKLKPDNYMGDSGFGNEENYEFLAEKGIGNYLKFNIFHYEQTNDFKNNPYMKENMLYDGTTDTYTCPAGRKLHYVEDIERITATGYRRKLKVYECKTCIWCKLAEKCKKGDSNRRFEISEKLEKHKGLARSNLNSEKGIELRCKRGVDVETPFADIKLNMGYDRFRLRGLRKATSEMLLLSLAHNMRKVAKTQEKVA